MYLGEHLTVMSEILGAQLAASLAARITIEQEVDGPSPGPVPVPGPGPRAGTAFPAPQALTELNK